MTEEEWLERFSENLLWVLENDGITQRELAERTGLSCMSINNYICRRNMPSIAAIINIAYALDISVSSLVDFGHMIKNKRR